MSPKQGIPSHQDIASVIRSMTGEQVLHSERMATGDQNFVYAIETPKANYVLRMTGLAFKHKFESALAWQKLLIPLGIPVAEFINTDIHATYSPFASLLMMRLAGDDLINIYPLLTSLDKKNLAAEMITIQARCDGLAKGTGYGILDSYDDPKYFTSWHEFLLNRMMFCQQQIQSTGLFYPKFATTAITIANKLKNEFSRITPQPFLWDASERNVLVDEGKITGIVDIDDMCFGDPLLVIALTSTCLQLEGFDTEYTDYWELGLELKESAKARLNFYKLFYAIAFMRKHLLKTANKKHLLFDTEKLQDIFYQSLSRLKNS